MDSIVVPVAEALPSKRVRKQTDKEFRVDGPQRKSAKTEHNTSKPKTDHPISKPNHHTASKPKHKAAPPPAPVPLVTNVLPSVAFSMYDKAAQLTLSKDQLLCHGCEGGYRMVRATQGVHRGSYYYEVEILKPPQPKSGSSNVDSTELPSHVRIGWSTRQGELQAPVGFDQHSYGYRDEAGSKVHKSVRIDKYGEAYGPGDVVGCHIVLFEDPTLNKMSFYKNGVDQGVAYSGLDIPTGLYHPAVSLYMKANVRVNFGPSFIKKPEIAGANAVSELQPMNPEDRKAHEAMILQIKQGRCE